MGVVAEGESRAPESVKKGGRESVSAATPEKEKRSRRRCNAARFGKRAQDAQANDERKRKQKTKQEKNAQPPPRSAELV